MCPDSGLLFAWMFVDDCLSSASIESSGPVCHMKRKSSVSCWSKRTHLQRQRRPRLWRFTGKATMAMPSVELAGEGRPPGLGLQYGHSPPQEAACDLDLFGNRAPGGMSGSASGGGASGDRASGSGASPSSRGSHVAVTAVACASELHSSGTVRLMCSSAADAGRALTAEESHDGAPGCDRKSVAAKSTRQWPHAGYSWLVKRPARDAPLVCRPRAQVRPLRASVPRGRCPAPRQLRSVHDDMLGGHAHALVLRAARRRCSARRAPRHLRQYPRHAPL